MGKSGAFMFFSADQKFILKTINREELETLKGFIFPFFNHIKFWNPSSLLSRIYGIYSIQLDGF